jgi:glutathione S-transferase
MIARLALTEAKIPIESARVDIHRRKQQFAPDYVRINPQMTVPALATSGGILSDSRDVLNYAFGAGATGFDAETERWVTAQYAFPIEELTMGRLTSRNPIFRLLVPKTLRSVHARLVQLAAQHSDLADLYSRRAAVFAERIRTFDPNAVARLFERRWADAQRLLDDLDHALGDGRAYLVGPTYGPADVVWTVFLARVRFIGQAAAIETRPSLMRYETAMRMRPSYRAAGVWPRIYPLKMVRQLFF